MNKERSKKPSYRLRTRKNLESAWNHIYSNGKNSRSVPTRKAIDKFKEFESTNITRIQKQLREGTYKFKTARGILAGKKKRPLVLAEVEDRVMQRAILNILQTEKSFQKYLSVKTSFGAIKALESDKKKGVPSAIKHLIRSIDGGAQHYYKSDIASFFTSIPLPKVLNSCKKLINDENFFNLLEKATNIEVNNLNELGDYKQYFDFNEVGTPQGCCLSPLIGNILLYDFDVEMNKGDITCLRYLDDFIILAPTERAVEARFRKACKILKELGLKAYTPTENPDKSQKGLLTRKYEYLGIELDGTNHSIRPNKKSISNILNSIKDLMDESLRVDFSSENTQLTNSYSLNSTLYKINNKLKGWGNQYFYCNDKALWGSIDFKVSELSTKYISNFIIRNEKRMNNSSSKLQIWKYKQRMRGLQLMSDCKSKPINW